MDEARKLRFLIPPFFFLASCFIGLAYSSDPKITVRLAGYTTEHILAGVAILGGLALPCGFFFSSVSIVLLHLLSRFRKRYTYEAVLPDHTWTRIGTLLDTDVAERPRWHLYAAATFDHTLLPPAVHAWIQRRWTTFNLSIHSFVAVLLSYSSAWLYEIQFTTKWVGFTVVMLFFLGCAAYFAWTQTMDMFAFQASRDPDVFNRTERLNDSIL